MEELESNELEPVEHRVKLIKGIFIPGKVFEGLDEAEKTAGAGWRLLLLAIINTLIGAGTTYLSYRVFGLPEQMLQQFQQAQLPISEDTVLTASVVLGGITGLVLTFIVPTIGALIYWPFFRDAGFKKLFTINLYVFLITIIASSVQMALLPVFRFQPTSYLSLGSITRLLTDSVFVNTLFGGITIFLIWKFFVLITAVNRASKKSKTYVTTVFIILNVLLLLIISVGTSFVQSETLLQVVETQTP